MLLVFVGTVVCMLEPGGDSSFLGNLMGVLSGVSFAAVTLAMARMGQEVTAGHIALANLCAFPIAFALMPSGRLAQFASLFLCGSGCWAVVLA